LTSDISSTGKAEDMTDPQVQAIEEAEVAMAYNDYGELVAAADILHPLKSKDMSILQILRIIMKGYHHNVSSRSVISDPSSTSENVEFFAHFH
jgi:hypothetical protein